MQCRTYIGIAAAFGIGGLAGAGLAQEDAFRGFGIQRSHQTEQLYDLPVGVTASGRARSPDRFTETRVHVVVPSHYGELFQISQDGHDSVLWFRAADGAIRNALLDASSAVPYQIERAESSRIEIKVR